MEFISKIFRGDRIVWLVFLFMCALSVLEIYSSSSSLTFSHVDRHFDPVLRHIMFLATGIGCAIVLHFIPFKYFPYISGAAFLFAIALLLWAVVGGVRLNDANRWVSFFGIQFQPSEFGKLAVVMLSSFILSKTQTEDGVSKTGFWFIIATSGFCIGLIFLDNLSTALLLGAVVISLMLLGNVQIKKIGLIILVAITFVSAVVAFVPESIMPRAATWRARIARTIGIGDGDDEKSKSGKEDDKYVITDENFQVAHAKIAISNGGILFGRGPGRSVQRDILPQAYSDFIFAIILEEWGVLGGLLVIFCYFLLIFRTGQIARSCDSLFGQLLAMGCALMIVFQATINMAVAVDSGLVTGQPLPLISRGGTSTIITCIYIGIILSVSVYTNNDYPDALRNWKFTNLEPKEENEETTQVHS